MATLDPRNVLKERPSVGLIIGLVLAGICTLVTLSFDIFNGGAVQFFIALVLAVAPVPLLLAGVLALDRMEPEPRANLAFAFAWGAGVAVLFAGLLNSLNLIYVEHQIGNAANARNIVATFVAPLVEETMKGLVLLGLLRFRRQELDGPTDGIIYASMVGLGFAMSENVSYYLAALSEHGAEGLAATVVLRGVLSPFAHPLFTSLIGISVAYAAQRQGKSGIGVIVAGWIGAMVLHGLWNGLASFGGFAGLAVAYLALMILLFIELGVIFRDRKRIVGLINRFLPPYEANGLINQADIFMLSSLKGRRQARQWAKAHGGKAGARAMSDYQLAATELGLLHERAYRGGIDEKSFRERQWALADLMAHARMSFPLPGRHQSAAARGMPPPGYAPGAPPPGHPQNGREGTPPPYPPPPFPGPGQHPRGNQPPRT
ncbi:PrsW family intramembrane metalloprotease [Microtetraspora sp. AC03309]|uniref:PrsW family intramembrane metalloprotease n=1 Tax=Microtetraspora sp. AC03309 TaxID=2779376 RepID=UPI001E3F3A19|nr:PrsW family intramembrane metalloprotease [Microtetraspora sp. AC03309]MCC5576019.1 PrsW family intramembrane metalloprotease [Microtetraspora sp. AC03309]